MAHHQYELSSAHENKVDEEVLAEIRQQLAQIQYGSLEISVHNGQIAQLDCRENNVEGKAKTLSNP